MSHTNPIIRIAVGLEQTTLPTLEQKAQYAIDQQAKINKGNFTQPDLITTSAVGTSIKGYNKVTNKSFKGVNFSSEDYLSVANHRGSIEEGIKALNRMGTTSGGSPLFYGVNIYTDQLIKHCTAYIQNLSPNMVFNYYSTGWLARYGSVRAMVAKKDSVIMDDQIHKVIIDGANASFSSLYYYKHNDLAQMEKLVKERRNASPKNTILVITNNFFVGDSTYTDVNKIASICRKYNAVVMFDVTDTFFCTGENGYSNLTEIQDYSNVFLVGSGSKALGVNFGFFASPYEGQEIYNTLYSPSLTFTNAIPAMAASQVVYNITNFVQGEEGVSRRANLLVNANYLREKLVSNGYEVIGDLAPSVVINVSCELLARVTVNLLTEEGAICSYLQYPDVPQGEARLKFNVQAHHTQGDADQLISALNTVLPRAKRYLESNPDAGLAKQTFQRYAKL